MKNLVVFASGSGTNFQSIVHAISDKKLDAKIAGFISNKPQCGAVKIAEANNIPVFTFDSTTQKFNNELKEEIISQLSEWNTDLIILAGFLLKIPEEIVNLYENRILNIHPSILPKYGGKGFYGMKVHEAVKANAEKFTGCTIHLVNNEFDKGPILAQSKIEISPSDSAETIAQKVLKEEHVLYPKTIQNFLNKI